MDAQTPLGFWIINHGGSTLLSYTSESEKVDEQLFGGVLSALMSFAHSLGEDIHKIDFGKSSLITFTIKNLRIVLMLRNPLKDKEISHYQTQFLGLEDRFPSYFKEEIYYEIADTPFADEIFELFDLSKNEQKSTIFVDLNAILVSFKRDKLTKKDAVEEMIKISKGLDINQKEIKNLHQKIGYLIKNGGFNEEDKKIFGELMEDYQTGLLKALSNFQSALFR